MQLQNLSSRVLAASKHRVGPFTDCLEVHLCLVDHDDVLSSETVSKELAGAAMLSLMLILRLILYSSGS